MPLRSHTKKGERRNVISLVAGELIWVESRGANPPDVLVPSEYAPVFAVDLPLAQHRMRVAALPFAIEDRVAQPINELHMALGPEVAPRRYLASVADAGRMALWQADLAASRIVPRRILPDATLLCPPSGDATWAVKVEAERVRVKTRDHEAFGTSIGLFDTLWRSAGCPVLQQVGPEWPPAFPKVVGRVDDGSDSDQAPYTVDLRQGAHKAAELDYALPLKIAAVFIACAAIAHTAILVLDTTSAGNAVAARRVEAERVLASVAPLGVSSADAATTLAAMLPPAGGDARTGRFLPLLSRVSKSIQADVSGVAIQALSYDEADGALLLKIEAADLPALERLERNLRDAGFSTDSGGATVGDGGAQSSITVREAAPGAAGG